jgi:hypothetical protein
MMLTFKAQRKNKELIIEALRNVEKDAEGWANTGNIFDEYAKLGGDRKLDSLRWNLSHMKNVESRLVSFGRLGQNRQWRFKKC